MTPGPCLLILVTEFHGFNVPFSFVSHVGMLIMCKWPRLNLGTGGPPHVHVALITGTLSPPSTPLLYMDLQLCRDSFVS